jgi:hypothetical protein
MGQYAPNTEIIVNPKKPYFRDISKEKTYLIASHVIYPEYNPAFKGGGKFGKIYTLEEWKKEKEKVNAIQVTGDKPVQMLTKVIVIA